MRWEDERVSGNVLDDRGRSFGGGGGIPLVFGGGGLGTIVLIGLALLFGVDPRMLLQGGGGYTEPAQQSAPAGLQSNDEDARFASVVLAFTEDTWAQVFAEQGSRYQPPTLVLYDQAHPTGCGFGQSAMGPFYCPADQRIYLDLTFFNELSGRFGAPGRFAEAYVIAHEVGHHIENLMGILPRVQQAQQAAGSRAQANNLSVRVELMADCLAGVWAAHANQRWKVLEPGDVEKAVRTAQAIGDDRLQQSAGGRVVPDSFTHGSAAQRVEWLNRGLNSGRVDTCNTFGNARRS